MESNNIGERNWIVKNIWTNTCSTIGLLHQWSLSYRLYLSRNKCSTNGQLSKQLPFTHLIPIVSLNSAELDKCICDSTGMIYLLMLTVTKITWTSFSSKTTMRNVTVRSLSS